MTKTKKIDVLYKIAHGQPVSLTPEEQRELRKYKVDSGDGNYATRSNVTGYVNAVDNRYRLDIFEEKTKKVRNFTVPIEIYSFIQQYALDNGIGMERKLFDISKRQVERHLNKVFSKMELPLRNYGSHSYRKYFATQVYVNNEMNIELVRVLLQHSSVAITQRYIGIGQKQIEEALAGTVANLI